MPATSAMPGSRLRLYSWPTVAVALLATQAALSLTTEARPQPGRVLRNQLSGVASHGQWGCRTEWTAEQANHPAILAVPCGGIRAVGAGAVLLVLQCRSARQNSRLPVRQSSVVSAHRVDDCGGGVATSPSTAQSPAVSAYVQLSGLTFRLGLCLRLPPVSIPVRFAGVGHDPALRGSLLRGESLASASSGHADFSISASLEVRSIGIYSAPRPCTHSVRWRRTSSGH